jgi:streptomycin 6-kinase
MYYSYSNSFAHTITSVYGPKGAQWLAQLSQLVTQCAVEWQLSALQTYPTLTYNYVLFGMMNDVPIVLKLRCDTAQTLQEAAALKAFESFGAVKLLAHNTQLNALLLERVVPGTPLSDLFPDEDACATRIAAKLVKMLHQAPIPETHSFPSLEQVIPDFTKDPHPLAPFIAHARTLRSRLLSTQPKQKFLLHGDFHAGNILLSSNSDTLIVIDPEGLVGDPLYDLAVYIRNPKTELITNPQAHVIVKNRINSFAQLLGYDAQRIYDWVYLQAVTSAYWSVEDGLDTSEHVAFLTLLQKISL